MARERRAANWLPSAPELEPFYAGVREFIRAHLRLPAGTDPKKIGDKLVVDPLLGYVHLSSWEVALIDTRLFQRLRRIRQLGLACLVFPTLGYSRFEHTLGVVGRLDQVFVKLQENARRIDRDHHLMDLIERYECAARLAALFHDSGHCAFSHLTERQVHDLHGDNSYPSSATIRQAFMDHFGTTKPVPFAEVFSVCFLGSPELVDFLEPLSIPGKRDFIERTLEHAARFVLGLPIRDDPESCFVAQLMSSGLDVDKLDYMPREAHFCGLVLEIDLARILDKLRVFQLKPAQFPPGLAHYKRMFSGEAKAAYHVLGLARGGQFAYEEFCVARVALYEKIYLHQKVRAAESQLSAKLARLPSVAAEFCQAHRWLWLKESCQEHASALIPTLDVPELFSQSAPTFASLQLAAIEDRSLLNRAFSFGPANCLTDPADADGEARPGSNRPLSSHQLMEAIARDPAAVGSKMREYVGRIVRELRGEVELPPGWDSQIIIDLPRYSPVQQGHDTLYFERPPRLPLKWAMPIDRIVDYYQRNRALGYIFAPREVCPVVLIAAERAIWDIGGAVFEQASVVSASVIEAATKIRHTLADAGFYEDARPLRPMPEYLQSFDAQELIQQVVQNLRSFESFRGERVTVSGVETFVSQLPKDLQEPCLRWLLLLRVVGDNVLVDTVGDALTQVREAAGGHVALVPLGGASDSATRMAYALRGQRGKDDQLFPQVHTLTDQVVDQNSGIVLFDDNVNTGRQALNIMAQWCGVKLPADVALAEEHVQRLGKSAIERLPTLRIGFAFSIGAEDAAEQLGHLLQKHCNIARE
jgi:HD superfamily phosphohydrolase